MDKKIAELCPAPNLRDNKSTIDPGCKADEFAKAYYAIGETMVEEGAPKWLVSSFVEAAASTVDKVAKAMDKLSIDGVLPVRLSDFRSACFEVNGNEGNAIELLVSQYFMTGRVANGATREDIYAYDDDLRTEVELFESLNGPLPKELHIPSSTDEVREARPKVGGRGMYKAAL